MWTDMRVQSLDPLSALENLRYFEAASLRVEDESLRALSTLMGLRRVTVPNRFRLEEYAELAVALPLLAESQRTPWFKEPHRIGEGAALACDRCRAFTLGWTLGKPTRRLCPGCDAPQVAKHVAKWGALIEAARRRDPTAVGQLPHDRL